MNPSPTRVLVPYISTFHGGVRRVLGAGLPQLAHDDSLRVSYSELCANREDMDDMVSLGVDVDRYIGVAGDAILAGGSGAGRFTALIRHTPRLLRIIKNLARRLPEYDVCYVHGHRELLLCMAAR